MVSIARSPINHKQAETARNGYDPSQVQKAAANKVNSGLNMGSAAKGLVDKSLQGEKSPLNKLGHKEEKLNLLSNSLNNSLSKPDKVNSDKNLLLQQVKGDKDTENQLTDLFNDLETMGRVDQSLEQKGGQGISDLKGISFADDLNFKVGNDTENITGAKLNELSNSSSTTNPTTVKAKENNQIEITYNGKTEIVDGGDMSLKTVTDKTIDAKEKMEEDTTKTFGETLQHQLGIEHIKPPEEEEEVVTGFGKQVGGNSNTKVATTQYNDDNTVLGFDNGPESSKLDDTGDEDTVFGFPKDETSQETITSPSRQSSTGSGHGTPPTLNQFLQSLQQRTY